MHAAFNLDGSGPVRVSPTFGVNHDEMQSLACASVGGALAVSGLAAVDARILMAHVLGRDRAWLVTHADEALEPPARSAFDALVRRRHAGEPVAYLTGRREFYGLDLQVGPEVLIPRPETEIVVDVALAYIPMRESCSVLDLGTGSGAIALALASQRPNARIVAVDVSPEALATARENAARLGIGKPRASFLQSDWWSAIPDARFDVIVSNPPYVAERDPHLEDGDVRFEPTLALRGGVTGLACIDVIVSSAGRYLQPDGRLVIEHGYDQAEAVRARFAACGFADVTGTRDLAGILRVTSGRWTDQRTDRGADRNAGAIG